jgi:hypothetical protein
MYFIFYSNTLFFLIKASEHEVKKKKKEPEQTRTGGLVSGESGPAR